MSQSSQGLGLNLSDSLTSDIKIQAHLFQRERISVIQSESHAQNFLLARRKRCEHFGNLLFQQDIGSLCRRILDILILNEVTEQAVFLFTHRGLKGDWLPADRLHCLDFLFVPSELLCDFLVRRLSAKLLQQCP